MQNLVEQIQVDLDELYEIVSPSPEEQESILKLEVMLAHIDDEG